MHKKILFFFTVQIAQNYKRGFLLVNLANNVINKEYNFTHKRVI